MTLAGSFRLANSFLRSRNRQAVSFPYQPGRGRDNPGIPPLGLGLSAQSGGKGTGIQRPYPPRPSGRAARFRAMGASGRAFPYVTASGPFRSCGRSRRFARSAPPQARANESLRPEFSKIAHRPERMKQSFKIRRSRDIFLALLPLTGPAPRSSVPRGQAKGADRRNCNERHSCTWGHLAHGPVTVAP